jgi:hypothetical protein
MYWYLHIHIITGAARQPATALLGSRKQRHAVDVTAYLGHVQLVLS